MCRTTLLALLLAVPAFADTLLPRDVTYDPAVPSPEKHLRYAGGERHLTHAELIDYMRVLANAAPQRVALEEYGRTHGRRPLVRLVITAPDNHKRLDAIRAARRGLTDPAVAAPDLANLPAVLWMGYGVHGNEPSATNVAPLVAYHLAAGTGTDHERLLNELVILLDPCLNPDGFDRFANWANDQRGAVPNADPNHREHREPWPSGRTNYYGFDLNRDWLPASQPESRGRLTAYHKWKPNVVLDFHEMGPNSTYFFQPGSPKQVHPLVPARNQELTRKLAVGHAAALDKLGTPYFTGERFDDFYPGKGSTYPDLHGGVGILFEQGSAAGVAIDTPNGRHTLAAAMRNQLATSLSSLRGTLESRRELLQFQRDSYVEAHDAARRGSETATLVAAPGDPHRLREFLDTLHRHDIRAYKLASDTTAGGRKFVAGDVYVVPHAQPEARFLKALFETRTEFASPTFYDVSAWTLPLAYALRTATLTNPVDGLLGDPYAPGPAPEFRTTFADDDIGYLIDWRSSAAPRVLGRLLAAGIAVRVAGESLTAGGVEHGPGTLAVPLGIQRDKQAAAVAILRDAAKDGVPVHPVKSGLTEAGINLGSSSFRPVPQPRLLVVVGEGVRAYESGELWHLFDRKLGQPATLVELSRLGTTNLESYTAVIVPNGTYANAPAAAAEKLTAYLARGGTVIAVGRAGSWLASKQAIKAKFRDEWRPAAGQAPYAQAEGNAEARDIPGTIFKTTIDATHPVCYGLPAGEPLPVMKVGTLALEPPESPYSTPVLYDREPLLCGYCAPENRTRVARSAGVAVFAAGAGRAILFADTPTFRDAWPATTRLMFNAAFFGPVTRVP